jgi:hypothetical protein
MSVIPQGLSLPMKVQYIRPHARECGVLCFENRRLGTTIYKIFDGSAQVFIYWVSHEFSPAVDSNADRAIVKGSGHYRIQGGCDFTGTPPFLRNCR